MNIQLPSWMKCIVMRVLVMKMRFLTKVLPKPTRAFVRWFATREIIACGLCMSDGRVMIIYTEHSTREHYRVIHKSSVAEELIQEERDFSTGLVRQVYVPNVQRGEVYKIIADRTDNTQRIVASPDICVKAETVQHEDILSVTCHDGGEVTLSWKGAARYDPMIYFLIIEDRENKPLVGVYLRANKWQYSQVHTVSYDIGADNIRPLTNGLRYKALLLLVDYDGWVGHMSETTFTYIP